MPRISIKTAQPSTKNDVLVAVRGVLGGSIAELKDKLANGKPLIEGDLHLTDDFDDLVKRLVADLEGRGEKLVIQYGSLTIDSTKLANIFERDAEELQRQYALMGEEAEAHKDE